LLSKKWKNVHDLSMFEIELGLFNELLTEKKAVLEGEYNSLLGGLLRHRYNWINLKKFCSHNIVYDEILI